jgi:WYL domain
MTSFFLCYEIGGCHKTTRHESQQMHVQDDGSIIFEAEVAGTDEIRFWIMTWGSEAEVLSPASLREEIRTETEMMASRYEVNTVAEERPPYSDRTYERPLQRN